MIFGSSGQPNDVLSAAEVYGEQWGVEDVTALRHDFRRASLTVATTSSGAASHDAGHLLHSDAGVTVALYGTIFNTDELSRELDISYPKSDAHRVGATLIEGYHKWGVELFKRCNGNFVIVIQDVPKHRVWIARDHLGIESLYYQRRGNELYFASNLQFLAHRPGNTPELNSEAVMRYLLFNYNPAFDSFFADIHKLRPGYVLRLEEGKMIIDPYWYISFKGPWQKSDAEYKSELLELFRDAIRLRVDADNFRTGAYLSGGMDSSTVVGLMREMVEGPIHSFSFRCRGKTFDESAYARLMSESYKTTHHEVPYEADDVYRITKLVEMSDEPFSDIGIEVASWLLAEKASGVVDYVLTGDGGDELFGGHPVYLADKMADRFEKVPAMLRHPLTNLLQKLPDTDAKKSLAVKAKRFSYSAAFPADLFSNRWRIYYKDEEFKQLLTGDWYREASKVDPLSDIKSLYHEADGGDFLSKTLYGDYYTVTGFYLRRMELVRKFGLEGRFPLFDHRLVEYTARIPSNLKIDKTGATKAIFHNVMAGTLPDEIVFRKDKLGHSVPFKNWLRDMPVVQNLIREYLTPAAIKKRGIFQQDFVQSMFDRHLRKADNHSHRLWALLVFELWCRKHLDAGSRPNVSKPEPVATA